jgi:acyl-CoA synthetase (AMP-forming)/AMP-acid ligase II
VNHHNTILDLLHSVPDDRTAVILPDVGARVSYALLRQQVMQLAEGLCAAGVGPEDRVATVFGTGLPAIVTFLAGAVAGAVAPLNPGYRRDDFRYYLQDASAKVLLCPPHEAAEAREAAEGLANVIYVDADSAGLIKASAPFGTSRLLEPDPDRVGLVLHTSGSTGRPKRVALRHRHMMSSAANIARHYSLSPSDVTICIMPLFHIHGLIASVLATILSGGAIVLTSKFNPRTFWSIARDHGVTWFSGVPTLHKLILARSGSYAEHRPERLRFIRSCSAALTADLMLQMEAAFQVPVLEAYGMTEACHQIASNPTPPAQRKPGSVGRGSGVDIRVIDHDGNTLAAGVVGEVAIAGPSVIAEYENNDDGSAASFINGWFRTGDQGFLDENGYLTLTGRLKELINRGGEKIAPIEIDEALLSHPAVAEAVAFGMADKTWGEEVAAAVVTRCPVTEAELLAHCEGRLAYFKRPQKIFFLSQLPRTATGKIQRTAIRNALGAPEAAVNLREAVSAGAKIPI